MQKGRFYLVLMCALTPEAEFRHALGTRRIAEGRIDRHNDRRGPDDVSAILA